jgi:hypothetical protein
MAKVERGSVKIIEIRKLVRRKILMPCKKHDEGITLKML